MTSVKQPWLKFFPADWRGDITLGTCSLAARGLWMEMLCIMTEASPRGSLVGNDGDPFSTKRLAAVARSTVKDVERLLAELEKEGVFSRDPEGTIFSRRMRRDVEKAEKDRTNGGAGGNPSLLRREKGGVNPTDNGEDKAYRKPEARSQKLEPEKDSARTLCSAADLARFVKAHPRPGGEDAVRRQLTKTLDAGATIDELCLAAEAYARSEIGKDPMFTKAAVGWLADGRWKTGEAKAGEPDRVFGRQYAEGWLIAFDSPQGRAWREYRDRVVRQGRRPAFPVTAKAWYFQTEWPPNQPAEQQMAISA